MDKVRIYRRRVAADMNAYPIPHVKLYGRTGTTNMMRLILHFLLPVRTMRRVLVIIAVTRSLAVSEPVSRRYTKHMVYTARYTDANKCERIGTNARCTRCSVVFLPLKYDTVFCYDHKL